MHRVALAIPLVLVSLARGQVGVLDQSSPYPPSSPPVTSGALCATLVSQFFDQEVRVGVHGTFEGFRFLSIGALGAMATVRVRLGPSSAPGATIHTSTVVRTTSGLESHFVDASAAGLFVVPGQALTLEFQGAGTNFCIAYNHVDPSLAEPLYPFPLWVNGSPFADGAYRFSFDTFTITTPGSSVYYCSGNGTGTPCPCGNDAPVGGPPSGCLHSANAGGVLRTSGVASIAADTLSLNGFSMPNAAALYLQGTLAEHSGLGSVLGDGLACVGGSIVRLGSKTNVGGASHYPEPANPSVSVRGGCAPGDVRNYQIWYRNAAAFCTSAPANLTNGAQVVWAP